MSFKDLSLLPELLRAIEESGYTTPTPVQAQAIPLILAGDDVIVEAQTGTGKTAGFTLPMLHRLGSKKTQGARPVRALILTPTRELAAQVGSSVATYGKHLPLKSTIIYGGVSINPQMQALRRGVDILIATPGRLLDHVSQGTVDLSKVEMLILDEADRMLDMGFIVDIRKIMTLLPKGRQNLLFSATISPGIRTLADSLMKAPKRIEIERRAVSNELVTQVIHPVDSVKKRALLSFLITSENWKQVLVFTRTKHVANRLTQALETDGIRATAIHGNKTQAARMKALSDFKRGSVQVLVATDVAARGIDIDLLPHVVNFELPHSPEDYIHRIGRTGRAGNEGCAVSLVCVDEIKLLKSIERLLKRELPRVMIPGYEPDPSIRAEPVVLRRGQGRSSGGPRENSGRDNSGRGGRGGAGGSGRGGYGKGRPQGDRPYNKPNRFAPRAARAPAPGA